MSSGPPYVKLVIGILTAKDLSPAARVVWAYLRHKQGANDKCWPAVETIWSELGLSVRTVQRALSELEKGKVLRRTRPENQGRGQRVNYEVGLRKGDRFAPLSIGKGAKSDPLSTPKRVPNLQKKGAKCDAPLRRNKNQEQEPTSLSVPDVWNSYQNLPPILTMTQARKDKLATRMREPSFADNWQAIIGKVAGSAFCTGDNDRGWKADIDWLLKNDGNYTKVLEGKYDRSNGKTSESDPPGPSDDQVRAALDEIPIPVSP